MKIAVRTVFLPYEGFINEAQCDVVRQQLTASQYQADGVQRNRVEMVNLMKEGLPKLGMPSTQKPTSTLITEACSLRL